MNIIKYRFTKRKGVYDSELIHNTELILKAFERKGAIQDITVSMSKISFGNGNNQFYLTPSNTKLKEIEQTNDDFNLVCHLVILLLKKQYQDDFEFIEEDKQDQIIWFKTIKYVNKMLKTRIRIRNEQFVF
jgi:ADP-ribosylglycohydrolase